jgi:putative membrane protein
MAQIPTAACQPPRDERATFGAILVGSAAAVVFLVWLVYLRQPPPAATQRWVFLPRINALLNGLSAVALCVGWYFIKRHRWRPHRASMLSAFGFSTVFLVSYVVNHALHGDTPFPHAGAVRIIYESILASHILASIVALPMILTTFYFAWRREFTRHRRLARVTFPIWLYVSVTGVVVFAFLNAYAYQAIR